MSSPRARADDLTPTLRSHSLSCGQQGGCLLVRALRAERWLAVWQQGLACVGAKSAGPRAFGSQSMTHASALSPDNRTTPIDTGRLIQLVYLVGIDGVVQEGPEDSGRIEGQDDVPAQGQASRRPAHHGSPIVCKAQEQLREDNNGANEKRMVETRKIWGACFSYALYTRATFRMQSHVSMKRAPRLIAYTPSLSQNDCRFKLSPSKTDLRPVRDALHQRVGANHAHGREAHLLGQGSKGAKPGDPNRQLEGQECCTKRGA